MGRPARLSRTHPELQEGAESEWREDRLAAAAARLEKKVNTRSRNISIVLAMEIHAYAKCESRRLCKVRAATFGVRGEADLIEAGLNGGTGRPSVSPSAGVAMGWVASITPANRSESRRSPTRNSRTAAQKEKAGFLIDPP